MVLNKNNRLLRGNVSIEFYWKLKNLDLYNFAVKSFLDKKSYTLLKFQTLLITKQTEQYF